jgi:hypothetical protein
MTGNVSFKGADGAPSLLSQIQNILHRSQLSNIVGYFPTDCPTREKHGWLGDALTTAEEAMYEELAGWFMLWINRGRVRIRTRDRETERDPLALVKHCWDPGVIGGSS